MGSNGSVDGGDSNSGPRAFAPVSQRERLLDAMAKTVAARGYASTAVADVLEVARISRRTFYEQFADKEDCFLAAYDQIATLCSERIVAAYEAELTLADGLPRAFDALLGTLASEPDFAYLGVVEVLAAGPRGIARRERLLERFARFIDHGRATAETVVTPPELVGQAIVGGIHELVYSQIVRGRTRRLPDLTGELVHYTLMLLGVRHPAT